MSSPPPFTTPTGLQVTFRRLRLEDAPYIVDLFDHLSPQSRYQRFQIPLNQPDRAWVQQTAHDLADVQEPGEGWLAFADLPDQPDACIGGGRFISTGPGEAEVSVTVRDDFQGQGLGAEILQLLFGEARNAGIHTLVAYVQATNQSVFRMLARVGIPYRRSTHQGETRIELDLSAPLPSP
jgi:RimJ/RimL family protein N-acetyltransferase